MRNTITPPAFAAMVELTKTDLADQLVYPAAITHCDTLDAAATRGS